jgi:hypothetical protein
MKGLLVWCALSFGCGPKSAPSDPQSQPTLDGEDTRTTLPVPDDEHFPVKGPLSTSAAALKDLIDVPLYIVDTTLLLFDDEQLEASAMIAQALRDAGLVVEDPKRTRTLFQRASFGQNVTTGASCGRELGRMFAAKRWSTELVAKNRVDTAIYCEDKCWIEVILAEGLDQSLNPSGKKAFYAAPFDVGQPWRTELRKRLGELVAFRSLRDYGPAKLVEGAVAPAPKPDIAFADTNFTFDLPAAFEPAMKKCLGARGPVGVLVETDAKDTVTKCEYYGRTLDGDRGLVPCVCTALAGKSLGGTGPRRAPIMAKGDPFVAKTHSGLTLNAGWMWDQTKDEAAGKFAIKVTHPSISSWDGPSYLTLERCFYDVAEGNNEAAVEVTFDQVGTATSVKIATTEGAFTPAMEKCAHDAFMTSLASCPAVPTSTGYAHLYANAYK